MTPDPTALPPTIVDVSDLIDQPGASRPVDVVLGVPDGFEVPLTELAEEVRIDGVLEALLEGVLLRGELQVTVSQQCGSCLEALPPATITAEVAELYSDPGQAEDPDDVEVGYAITQAHGGTVIDVDTLVRDVLSAAVPASPRCREDCKGLCPSCGVNRNHETCECREDTTDDRWSALASLKLDNP